MELLFTAAPFHSWGIPLCIAEHSHSKRKRRIVRMAARKFNKNGINSKPEIESLFDIGGMRFRSGVVFIEKPLCGIFRGLKRLALAFSQIMLVIEHP